MTTKPKDLGRISEREFVVMISVIMALTALAIDRYKARRLKARRAASILGALAGELRRNHRTLLESQGAFNQSPWGRSFYVDTAEWETALASGDLADIIGLEPTEVLEVHWVPLAEAVEWTRQGKITDAKTVIGLLRTFDLTAQGTP